MNNNTNAAQVVAARSNLGHIFFDKLQQLWNCKTYGKLQVYNDMSCLTNSEEFDYKGNGQIFCRCKSNSVLKKTTRSDFAFYNNVVTFYVPVDKCVSL